MRDHLQDTTARHDMSDVVRGTRLRRLTKRLRELVGTPFYEDARVAIYAPWGDPPTCDPETIEQDDQPRLRPVFLEDLQPSLGEE